DRRNPLRAAMAGAEALRAVGAARSALRRRRADVVLGGGGYVAGPAGLAAILTGTPLVLTEADSHLGLTNRLLARGARRVCLAFPLEGRTGTRYRVTGRPVPPPVTDRDAARTRFGMAADDTCVLVFGGSLGARSINDAAVEALAGAPFRVLHACGTRDFEALRERLGDPSPANYDLQPYITPFGDALAAADLTGARAGGSIFEVAAHGVPAIRVPYPHAAADHQTANARWMVDAGAAIVIADAELTSQRLGHEVGELLGDRGRLAAMATASASLARPDAARDIAQEILRAIDG
ncbi:MAG: UDP-N-acetylglucosamine--N-acetylmuramyl-(pentapeptide) pyrophosphoryl-undecaprenol, partial [Baekduia sp.]|nr:UDP-N-acetylglucosamine--N-acetylmuramyl-(pentapeptide) pyrophosphoryl-undecaprenol [Baekduia sp.]